MPTSPGVLERGRGNGRSRLGRRPFEPSARALLTGDRVLAALTVLAPAAVLAACATSHDTLPARSATEELLISSAADRAIARMRFHFPPGAKVFVDAHFIEGLDTKYTTGLIRDGVLRSGGRLVATRDKADIVVEPRIGAQSIDQNTFLIGIPSITLPVPLAGPLTTPEIALFKRDAEKGTVKAGATAYGAKTGEYDETVGPVIDLSRRTHWIVLLVIDWTTLDYPAEPYTAPGNRNPNFAIPSGECGGANQK